MLAVVQLLRRSKHLSNPAGFMTTVCTVLQRGFEVEQQRTAERDPALWRSNVEGEEGSGGVPGFVKAWRAPSSEVRQWVEVSWRHSRA